MDISLTDDMKLVAEIVTSNDIWERASEGDSLPEGFKPTHDEYCNWLIFRENNTILGIIYIHSETSISLDMHLYTIKKHRKLAKEMMMLFFKWFVEKTSAAKLNATVPSFYPEVINFAKKVGFQDEGINRLSYLYKNEAHDQQNLGITRKEIERILWH